MKSLNDPITWAELCYPADRAKRRARNSPPWRRPSWSMPWPTPADRCHSTETPSAARPCVCLEQRLRRDQVVAVAVDQQHRRPRFDFGREGFRIDVLGRDQQAGIADDRGRRDAPAQADMQRHHRPLAEADQRQRRRAAACGGSSSASRKRSSPGAALLTPTQRSFGIAKSQSEPLPPDRRLRRRVRARAAKTKAACGRYCCQARPISIRSLPSAP